MKIFLLLSMSMVFLISLAIMWLCEFALIQMVMRTGYGALEAFITFPLSAVACYHSLYCIRETRRGALTAGLGSSSKLIERVVMTGFVFLMMLFSVGFWPVH